MSRQTLPGAGSKNRYSHFVMFRQSLKRVFAALLFLGFLCASLSAPAASLTDSYSQALSNSYQGIQIEFPAGGELRIENELGAVAAEVWKERYISVATTEGTAQTRGASVVIEKKAQGYVVRVVRRPVTAPAVPINLTIRIPETARVEIAGRNDRISLRGVPASATIKSVGGDVDVEFVEPVDADIAAKSLSGQVQSTLPRLQSESGRVLQARLGTGSQALRINSDRGNITLSLASGARTGVALKTTGSTPPESLGSEVQGRAAGTPAPALDAQDVDEGDVIRVDSQLVTLNVSVIDRNTNRGVVGLTKSDFRLFENGAEQEILQFDSSSAPFDLLLLIDLSGSTRDVLKLIRGAALRFINAARPSDRIGVIAFAGHAEVISPLTLDRQLLRQQVSAIETAPAGDTKLYDALDFTLSRSIQDSRNPRRTAIILMSDGLDNSIPGVRGDGSKLPYKDLLNRLQESDGVLYTLWLNTEYESLSPLDTQPEAFDAGHDQMKEMADIGGGVFYEVERLEDLAGAYERVVADLGTVYSLAYRPADKVRDGRWRAIRVNIDRPATVARGKRGYYAN